MATSPIVRPVQLIGTADGVTCDQLVDLFWFYGAANIAASHPVLDIGNPHHAAVAHAKDVKLIETPDFKESPATNGSLQYDCHAMKLCGEIAALDRSNLCVSNNGEPLNQELPGNNQCTQLAASVKWLAKVFDTFDENKDGLLSLEELRRSFEKLGLQSSNVHCLLRHCGQVSHDQKGIVSQDDFLQLYHGVSCRHCNSKETNNLDKAETMGCNGDDAEEDLILDAFNVFDKDGDGFISPTELQSVLCSLGFGVARELDACIEMIQEYDRDGDGKVDLEEFKDMLNSAIKPR